MSEIFVKLHIEALEQGGYLVTNPVLPGLFAHRRIDKRFKQVLMFLKFQPDII